MKHTTLKEIEKYQPCADGWRNLLNGLGKKQADDDPITFMKILENNGIENAVWVLRVLPFKEQAMFRADVAASALSVFEKKCPNDNRPRKAIETLKMFARGEVGKEDLERNSDYTFYGAADSAFAAYTAAAAADTDATTDDVVCGAVAAFAAYSDVDFNNIENIRIKKWQEIEKLFVKHFS